MEERSERLKALEKEAEDRLSALGPREAAVSEKEQRLKVQERDLRRREEEVLVSREGLERRQAEVTKREGFLTALYERSASYEASIQKISGRIEEAEQRALEDEVRLRKLVEDAMGMREGLLAKEKAMSEMEELLAEGRRIVTEEQKRYLAWERQLNEREISMSRRETPSDEGMPVENEAEDMASTQAAMEAEAAAEAEAAEIIEPVEHREEIEAPAVDEPETPIIRAEPEEEPETPVFRASDVPLEEPETPVFKAEDDEAETPVFRADDVSPEEPETPVFKAADQERTESTPAEDTGGKPAVKKTVSIKKVIRRK